MTNARSVDWVGGMRKQLGPVCYRSVITGHNQSLHRIDVNNMTGIGGVRGIGLIPPEGPLQDVPIKNSVCRGSELAPQKYTPELDALIARPQGTVTVLRNSDFATGTYRITEPGQYCLGEDIVFSPNPQARGRPTDAQRQGEYSSDAYRLGFFAAITVETNDVVIDLGCHKLEQSELHRRQQRFYAHIELGQSPFPTGAGPADLGVFGDRCERVIIRNGRLGRSAHHGIHGNNPTVVLIEKLDISEAEVAAISINGGSHLAIRNVDCKDIGLSPANSKLSQAIFLLPFLERLLARQGDATFPFADGTRSLRTTVRTLISDVDRAWGGDVPAYMAAQNGLSDAHAYGIVLAGRGIHIGPIKRGTEPGFNENLFLRDITIDVKTAATEVTAHRPAYADASDDGRAYGSGGTTGPVGDVLDIDFGSASDGTYKGNPLLDGQVLLGALASKEHKGRSNVGGDIIQWAQGGVLGGSRITGRDSMGHVTKGNIGIFMPQACGYDVRDICVLNISCDGTANSVWAAIVAFVEDCGLAPTKG